MSGRSRHLLVSGLIGVYFLWPFVQQQLVLRYGTDPWKFAGWAMYTTIHPRVELQLEGIKPSGTHIEFDRRATPSLNAAAKRFLLSRRTFGLLIEPAAVASRLAQSYPNHASWILTVDRIGLKGDGWIGAVQRSAYTYRLGPDGIELAGVSYPPLEELSQ